MLNNGEFQSILDLLERGDISRAGTLLAQRDFHDIARFLNRQPRARGRLFAFLPPELQAQAALRLSNRSKRVILPEMTDETIAAFLQFSDEDDAVDLLQLLPAERQQAILGKIRGDKQAKIEHLFQFSPETAGGLMDLNFIIVKPTYTLNDVAAKVQKHVDREGKVPFVLVTDEKGRLLGHLSYRTLITSQPTAAVAKLIRPLPSVVFHTDQEEVARLAQNEKTDVIGVTDESGLVLGVVRTRDLISIAEREATEDVYRFAGVHADEDVHDPSFTKVRRRYRWLIVNLLTATLGAFVVSRFQDTISQVSLLAVFMPMVAGLGGNAATQTLAVVVRGLATGEVPRAEGRKIIRREAFAGALNGVIVGCIAGAAAILFRAPVMLGVALGSAMIVNLFVAGTLGAVVPLLLKRWRVDPAVASSIFVTAFTDISGFLVFLGLGSWLLLGR